VNALRKGLLDLDVAFAAGFRDVEFVNRRLGVVGGEDLMRSMAIGADGGFGGAFLDSAAVHTFLIGDEGLRALAV